MSLRERKSSQKLGMLTHGRQVLESSSIEVVMYADCFLLKRQEYENIDGLAMCGTVEDVAWAKNIHLISFLFFSFLFDTVNETSHFTAIARKSYTTCQREINTHFISTARYAWFLATDSSPSLPSLACFRQQAGSTHSSCNNEI